MGNEVWATDLFWSLSLILQASQSHQESESNCTQLYFPLWMHRNAWVLLLLTGRAISWGEVFSFRDRVPMTTVKCRRTEFGERLGGSSVMNAHGATLEQGRGKLLRELSGQW